MIAAIPGGVEQVSVMPDGIDPAHFVSRLAQIRRVVADRLGATPAGASTARLLARLEAPLSRPLRVAVLGDTNSGKTTIINRLLGRDLLVADVIQNTRLAALVRYARVPSLLLRDAAGDLHPVGSGGVEVRHLGRGCSIELGLPLSRLEGLELIDMPGLVPGADPPAWPQHGPSPDIAIWCTMATQAWRATEIATWRALHRPSRTSLLVATRSDLLPTTDRSKVLGRLQSEAGSLFQSIVMTPPENGGEDVLVPALDATVSALRAVRCRKAAGIIRRHSERLEGPGHATRELVPAANKA